MWRALGVTAAVVALAGIGFTVMAIEPGAASRPAQASVSLDQSLVEVAQESLQKRLRNQAGLRFSDLSVVRFGPVDERAVCGKVGGMDFILRVLLPRDGAVAQDRDGRRYTTVLEQGPGLPVAAGAAERFCREDGAVVARAVSPAPSIDSAPAAPSAQAPAQGSGPGATASEKIGAVQVRSPANIRVAPMGGAEVLGVAPQGAALRVFSRAPGGWLQVGEAAPQGWVHSSLLTGAP